jgi:hypothetical protein
MKKYAIIAPEHTKEKKIVILAIVYIKKAKYINKIRF